MVASATTIPRSVAGEPRRSGPGSTWRPGNSRLWFRCRPCLSRRLSLLASLSLAEAFPSRRGSASTRTAGERRRLFPPRPALARGSRSAGGSLHPYRGPGGRAQGAVRQDVARAPPRTEPARKDPGPPLLNQFRAGSGNYTAERMELFQGLSVKDIAEQIKAQRKSGT